MAILFIRFGWFMLGVLFGAWIMYDHSRALAISGTVNDVWINFEGLIVGLIKSAGF